MTEHGCIIKERVHTNGDPIDSPEDATDREYLEETINKVSSTIQETSEGTRASFPDLRDMLNDNDLGMKTGDRAPTEAVDAAVHWFNLEGQQGISDVVEQDLQDLALEHIHDTVGDSTGDEDEDSGDGEENYTDYNSPEEIQLCVDRLARWISEGERESKCVISRAEA